MPESTNLKKNRQLLLGLFGLVILFAFQNCSSDAFNDERILEPQTFQTESSGLQKNTLIIKEHTPTSLEL